MSASAHNQLSLANDNEKFVVGIKADLVVMNYWLRWVVFLNEEFVNLPTNRRITNMHRIK